MGETFGVSFFFPDWDDESNGVFRLLRHTVWSSLSMCKDTIWSTNMHMCTVNNLLYAPLCSLFIMLAVVTFGSVCPLGCANDFIKLTNNSHDTHIILRSLSRFILASKQLTAH